MDSLNMHFLTSSNGFVQVIYNDHAIGKWGGYVDGNI